SDREGYAIYRRVMAHFSTIQDRHALYVEPLHYQYDWTVPASSVTPETYQSTYKDLLLSFDADAQNYHVSKRINARVMITNYDPAIVPNQGGFVLHQRADDAPVNAVVFDIRPGSVGGEWPMRGTLRLRSFHEVLTFIARGMGEEAEYDVPPDPRTPAISDNP